MKEHVNQCKGVLHLCVFTVTDSETDNICQKVQFIVGFVLFWGYLMKRKIQNITTLIMR